MYFNERVEVFFEHIGERRLDINVAALFGDIINQRFLAQRVDLADDIEVIQLCINGDCRALQFGTTVTDLLAAHDLNPKMVVIEHNGEILARDRYAVTILAEGDNLEIVQMMAGG